jgi:hypothetical protein
MPTYFQKLDQIKSEEKESIARSVPENSIHKPRIIEFISNQFEK